MAKAELIRRGMKYLKAARATDEGVPESEADLQEWLNRECYASLSVADVCQEKAAMIRKGSVPLEELESLEASPFWGMLGQVEDEYRPSIEPPDPQARIPF